MISPTAYQPPSPLSFTPPSYLLHIPPPRLHLFITRPSPSLLHPSPRSLPSPLASSSPSPSPPWHGGARELDQARAAVVDLLIESGLPPQDSALVASKAPLYVQSLLEAARELEELDNWRLGTHATGERPLQAQSACLLMEGDGSLRQKIFRIAKSRQGREIFAVLESIGVGQRHIVRISHLLASERLSALLQKIRFLEDLFPDRYKVDDMVARIRQMMMQISIDVDEHLQKTLSFFEKMEAQRGGLSVLNSRSEAVVRLLEEFPEILSRELDADLKPVITFLEAMGVPSECTGYVLLCFPPVLLYNPGTELHGRMRILRKIGVRARDLGGMLVKYPWLLSRNVEKNVGEIVGFLVDIKVPTGKVDHTITKCPRLLGCSCSTLKLMVRRMNDIGVKSKRLGHVVAQSPQLLGRTVREFNEVLAFLEGLGLESYDMGRLLKRTPEVFASNILVLQSKVTFLLELGIPQTRLKLVVTKYPEFLVMSVEGTLKPRVEFLQTMGLSKNDISFMICGFPPLLGYSINGVLKPKLEFLQNIIHRSVHEVVLYPRFFSYCLEKRIKPRFKVLMHRNINCDLKTVLSKSNSEFEEEYLGVGRMLVPPIRTET